MVGVVAVSEILVGSVEETSKQFGFGELFVGAIIVGIVGNALNIVVRFCLQEKERSIYQ